MSVHPAIRNSEIRKTAIKLVHFFKLNSPFDSLFYDLDKDKEPKKIADYAIWFNSDETATINMEGRISGELDKVNAKILRGILISD